MEMKVILRTVLSSVEVEAADRRAERQSRLQRFTLVPAHGGRVVVRDLPDAGPGVAHN